MYDVTVTNVRSKVNASLKIEEEVLPVKRSQTKQKKRMMSNIAN
jgi:hypothetical protein